MCQFIKNTRCKGFKLLLGSVVGSILIGCNNSQTPQNNHTEEAKGSIQSEEIKGANTEVTQPADNSIEVIMDIDYSTYFAGINGCAVFF